MDIEKKNPKMNNYCQNNFTFDEGIQKCFEDFNSEKHIILNYSLEAYLYFPTEKKIFQEKIYNKKIPKNF